MAKLGDAFSEPERKKSVLRRLVPGAVVYLRRDSWIACHSVLILRTDAVVADLVADMNRFKGSVHRDVLDEIAAAVKRAPTLSAAEQARLVESLQREQD